MKVSREVINDSIHLITDYQYENDNIGINLELINTEKSNKVSRIPSMPISSVNATRFNFDKNEITLNSNIQFIDDTIYTIIKQSESNITRVKIPDEVFAEEMIQTCLLEKKTLKNMPTFNRHIDEKIEEIKEAALENNYLIKTESFNYKLYIYNEDDELLGIANRLMQTNTDDLYMIGEYIGKRIEFAKLKIDMCINDFLTLQLTDVVYDSSTNGTINYVKIDISHAYCKKIDVQYDNIKIEKPKTLALPNQNNYDSTEDYLSRLLDMNSTKELTDFYKLNRISKVPTINVNKYLIW